MTIPKHYVPRTLSQSRTQRKHIRATRTLYKKGTSAETEIVSVKTVASCTGQENAQRFENCPFEYFSQKNPRLQRLRQIKKGRGAYYSSGSRPNQTAQSWARPFGQFIDRGNAALVDYHILSRM